MCNYFLRAIQLFGVRYFIFSPRTSASPSDDAICARAMVRHRTISMSVDLATLQAKVQEEIVALGGTAAAAAELDYFFHDLVPIPKPGLWWLFFFARVPLPLCQRVCPQP